MAGWDVNDDFHLPWSLLAKIAGELGKSEAEILKACGAPETKAGQATRKQATTAKFSDVPPPPSSTVSSVKRAIRDIEREAVARSWTLPRDVHDELWQCARVLGKIAHNLNNRRAA